MYTYILYMSHCHDLLSKTKKKTQKKNQPQAVLLLLQTSGGANSANC